MLDKYPQEVKLVFKNYPLTRHKFVRKAAAAALAAYAQGKFWEFHDRLFKKQRNLNDAVIQESAKELGLDMERFDRDRKAPAIQKLIMRDLKDARAAGVRSIPTIFINGKLLRNRSLTGFQQMIEAELKKSR